MTPSWTGSRPASISRGYATEAARAAVEVAFDRVGLAALGSMTNVRNEPPQAVMRRLRLKQHSFLEHPGIPVGNPARPHVADRMERPGDPTGN